MRTRNPIRNPILAALLCALAGASAHAQTAGEIDRILERLERIERANQALSEEVRALRVELAARTPGAASAPLAERVEVVETRVAEQADTKVESSQRFPIRLTGMALFNTFLNSRNNGGSQYPVIATPGLARNGGAAFRQTVIGLDFRGPQTVWGGKLHGSVFMDFFGGSGQLLDQSVRLRTGVIALDWKQRSIAFGLDKPIFAPREPDSFAQVGVSPLTGAGNLWLWIPQARFEQDFRFGESSGLRAQVGVVQTRESTPRSLLPAYTPGFENARPAIEGRFEFRHGAERRIEIAPGFHNSVSHVDGFSVPSRLFSLDWLISPWRPIEFTGAFFSGQNVAPLGTGGAGGGILIPAYLRPQPVHAIGGWGQIAYRVTPRLSFHLFSGQQDNRESDVIAGQVGKNLSFGANLFYRIAPNVIVSFESSQVRTRRTSTTVLNNHYDLALAYLF